MSAAPRWGLGAAAAILLALAALAGLAPRPAVDNAPASWFPQDAPGRAGYAALVETYGGDEVLLIEVSGGDAPGLLQLVETLEQTLKPAPGVESVLGPFSVFPNEVGQLTDPELAPYAVVDWVFRGPLNQTMHLYEPELPRARVAAVLRPGSVTERSEFEPLLAPFKQRALAEGRTLRVAGQPLVNVELDRAGQAVEQRAMPLLVGVCVALLLLLTRSVRRGLALLVPVGLIVFASEGLLGLVGGTSNLIVTITKPLLFVLLLATGAHLLVEFAALRRAGASGPEAAWGAARHKAWACVLALATTALGFGSLALSSIGPIRTFGWLSAAGLLLGAPGLLILLPALLGLVERGQAAPVEPRDANASVPPGQSREQPSDPAGLQANGQADGQGESREADGGARLGLLTARVMALSAARPWLWISLGFLGVGLGGYGASQLSSQPHAIRYLPAAHPVRADYEALEAAGAPLAQLELLVGGPAPITSDIELLRAVDVWIEGASKLPHARGAIGPTLFLREVGYRTAKVDDFPADFLLADIMDRQREQFAAFLSRGGQELRFSLALDTVGPEEMHTLEDELRASFGRELAPRGLSLELSGSYPLLLGTQEALLSTLRQSLITTAILMQVVLVLALGSWRLGLAALLPNAFPVAIVLGTMWVCGIPLDVGTSMAAAIALGIAVDDTLHVLCAFRGTSGPNRLAQTARSAGAAILLSSLVVAAGFLSITSAPFEPTRNFGFLCAVAMAAALAGDLLLLPACLRVLGADPAAKATPAQAEPTGS